MKKRLTSYTLCLLLAITLWSPARADSGTEYKAVLEETLENIYFTVTDPICGSVGGEWAALALARGGYEVGCFMYSSAHPLVDCADQVLLDETFRIMNR